VGNASFKLGVSGIGGLGEPRSRLSNLAAKSCRSLAVVARTFSVGCEYEACAQINFGINGADLIRDHELRPPLIRGGTASQKKTQQKKWNTDHG
jgi:hypothetical protein